MSLIVYGMAKSELFESGDVIFSHFRYLHMLNDGFLGFDWLLKPVFHKPISSREVIFLFCLRSVSSAWLQLKAQEQRKKSLRAKKIASGKPA